MKKVRAYCREETFLNTVGQDLTESRRNKVSLRGPLGVKDIVNAAKDGFEIITNVGHKHKKNYV